VGRILADRIKAPFLDLDRVFAARLGNISAYIVGHGYEAYARENVEAYRQLLRACGSPCVLALSSGFMTYPETVHPEYRPLRDEVTSSVTTFVLLPSLELNECVREIVRRQLGRSFARSPAAEEAVIRERFTIYAGLTARKVETMRPPAEAAEEILMKLRPGGSPAPLSD
jgi:shikimate kinase